MLVVEIVYTKPPNLQTKEFEAGAAKLAPAGEPVSQTMALDNVCRNIQVYSVSEIVQSL